MNIRHDMRINLLAALFLLAAAPLVHGQTSSISARVVEVAGVELSVQACGSVRPGVDSLVELLAPSTGLEYSSFGVWRVTGTESCAIHLSAVCSTVMPAPGQQLELVLGSWTNEVMLPPTSVSPPPRAPQTPRPEQTSADRTQAIATQIEILRSSEFPRERRDAAKTLYRHFRYEPEVQLVASEVLLAGYDQLVHDSYHVDAMAWLTNILGRSGDPRFREVLDEVARNTHSQKLYRYAARNLSRLP